MSTADRALRAMGKAGALAMGVGLIIFGAAWWRASSLTPLPPIENIEPVSVSEVIEVFELDDRVFTLEQRALTTDDALAALKPLGPRVAAVEARAREIEARVAEIDRATVQAVSTPAAVPKIVPRPVRAVIPRRPSCPILGAAASLVRF